MRPSACTQDPIACPPTAVWLPVEVACRSDYTYAQEPRTITWPDGTLMPVEHIRHNWLFPGGHGFLAVAAGKLVELRYLEAREIWEARSQPLVA